jgi:phage gp29-like protein
MRLITSPGAFKTCYISEVKEELGLLKGKRGKVRKTRTPQHLKPFIRQAIKELGNNATYKEIQRKALELYQESVSKEIEAFFGMFKTSDERFVEKVAEDEGIYYGLED